MRNLFRRYHAIPPSVLQFIAAEQLLALVNVVLMLIFNLVLRDLGHDDGFIARITSYRYFGALVLALPAGMLLRGRRLKPVLLGASVLIPGATLMMLQAAQAGNASQLSFCVLVWGIGQMLLQVASLPLVVRHTPAESSTEAISLNFATFSLAMICCGVVVPSLRAVERVRLGSWSYALDETGIIRLFALVAFLAVPLVLCLREDSPRPGDTPELRRSLVDYDWRLIAHAVAPHLAIAVGAGLTIPFVNLFFNSVFDLTSSQFSMLGGVAGVLVLLGALFNPAVKRRFGYRIAILLSQSLAVAFLIGLALTEVLASRLPGMMWVAGVCYVLRQPLMNMAQPITSELAMSFVGERNRELIAALHASIWSGAWFLSARLFRLLRAMELPYWQIFLLTAALYSIGIVLFARLISAHERSSGLIEAGAERSRSLPNSELAGVP